MDLGKDIQSSRRLWNFDKPDQIELKFYKILSSWMVTSTCTIFAPNSYCPSPWGSGQINNLREWSALFCIIFASNLNLCCEFVIYEQFISNKNSLILNNSRILKPGRLGHIRFSDKLYKYSLAGPRDVLHIPVKSNIKSVVSLARSFII